MLANVNPTSLNLLQTSFNRTERSQKVCSQIPFADLQPSQNEITPHNELTNLRGFGDETAEGQRTHEQHER